MITLTQHIPNFVDMGDNPRKTGEVACAKDLDKIRWVHQWTEMPNFHRWSQATSYNILLIAEFENG